MSRRSVRLLLVLLAVATTGAAVYRGVSNERARQGLRAAAQASDRAAEETLALIADLRASQHAYVAAGQGEAFWTARVTSLFDGIRTRVLQLESPGGPTGEVLDGIDQLAAADKRARDLLSEGQPLMAGDIIFTESKDLADAAGRQVGGVRASLARASGMREAALEQEQYLLAGGALGAWILVALLLLPRATATPAGAAGVLHVTPQPGAATDDGASLKLNEGFDEPLNLELAAGGRAPVPVAPPPPVALPAVTQPASVQPMLVDLATLCGDLARVTDAASLNPLLARTASVLDATGVILWMAAPGGDLMPAASHGYDARLLARLGSVPRSAGNLTASVFREGQPRTTPAAGASPAAVAVPVTGSTGVIGVLSAELSSGADATRTTSGAAIVAAQLATLLGAPAAPESDTADQGSDIRRTGS